MTQPVRRKFPGRHDQVACARAFVTEVLRCCPVLDDAILMTSELCTNALQHSESGNGGSFEVTVYVGPGSLRIEVRDDGAAGRPMLRDADDAAEDGRGLEIVGSSPTDGGNAETNTGAASTSNSCGHHSCMRHHLLTITRRRRSSERRDSANSSDDGALSTWS